MKVAYLVRNPGIAERTPAGWEWAIIAGRADGRYTEEDLRAVADADVLVVGVDPVPEALFARAPRLKLIQRLGVGCDNIDVGAAGRLGIRVCTMPDVNAAGVAEHTIMLILALQRRLFESTLLMKAGRWPLSTITAKGIFELRGKTLGILGFGAIGKAVAERAKPFDVRLLYHDSRSVPVSLRQRLDAVPASLEVLLRESDVLTIHVPLTPKTRRLIGEAELRKMKPTALLINTARGAVVDEAALARALEHGDIAGAGLDVFAEEPLDARHPLVRCPNVVLTPHAAGQTREAMERMVTLLLENLQHLARGEELCYLATAGGGNGDVDRS